MSQVKLEGASLEDSNLQKAKLRGVNLSALNLSGVNLAEADLSAANLTGTNLERASLQKANLIRANLEDSNFQKADLTDAQTYGWNIKNADFTGATMPDGEIYEPVGDQRGSDREIDNKQTSQQASSMLPKRVTSTRKIIRTDKAPAPVGPYNQAIVATGNMMFVAGQIAIDLRLNNIVYTDDVAKQTEQVMANLEAILTEAGATWLDVVKTTVFLKDMNDFAAVNAVYAKYFDAETAPARACVEVSRLPKDVLVEIDCIAVI